MTLIGIWKYLFMLLHSSGKKWYNVLNSDRYVITVNNGLTEHIYHTRFQRGRVTPPHPQLSTIFPLLARPGVSSLFPWDPVQEIFYSPNLPQSIFIILPSLWPALVRSPLQENLLPYPSFSFPGFGLLPPPYLQTIS